MAPDCPAVSYNIQASNCGSCPATTNYTNVTCTDIPTDGSKCTFAIRTVVCGNIIGKLSEVMNITPAVDMHINHNGKYSVVYYPVCVYYNDNIIIQAL